MKIKLDFMKKGFFDFTFPYGSIRRVFIILLSFVFMMVGVSFLTVPMMYSRWFTGETAQTYIETERFKNKMEAQYNKIVPLIEEYMNVKEKLENVETLNDKQDILHIFTGVTDSKGKCEAAQSENYTIQDCIKALNISERVEYYPRPWNQYCYYDGVGISYSDWSIDTRKWWESIYREKQAGDGTSMYVAVEGRLLEEWFQKNGTRNTGKDKKKVYKRAKKSAYYVKFDKETVAIYNGGHEWMGSCGHFQTPDYFYFPVCEYRAQQDDIMYYSDSVKMTIQAGDSINRIYQSNELENSPLIVDQGVLKIKTGYNLETVSLEQLFAQNIHFFTKRVIMYESVRPYWQQYALLRCIDEVMDGLRWELSDTDRENSNTVPIPGAQPQIGTLNQKDSYLFKQVYYFHYDKKAQTLRSLEQAEGSNTELHIALPKQNLLGMLRMNNKRERAALENLIYGMGKGGNMVLYVPLGFLFLADAIYLILHLLFSKKEYQVLCKKKEELLKQNIKKRTLEDIPFDILCLCILVGGFVLMEWFDGIGYKVYVEWSFLHEYVKETCLALMILIGYLYIYGSCSAVFRGIRAHTWKYCICFKPLFWVGRSIRKICFKPVHIMIEIYRAGTWKKRVIFMAVGDMLFIGVCLFLCCLAAWNYEMEQALFFLLLMGLGHGLIFYYVIKNEYGKTKVLDGIKHLEEGDFCYRVDTKGLSGEWLAMAEALPQIGEGIQKAVEKSMKDERLKTELITNVSHDIKTPLTSIINYIDLLKRAKPEGEHVEHYLDVLTQKSQRLKQLIEDLVEASKISSGAIVLQKENLNFVELLTQVCGEFHEKLSMCRLELICNLPDCMVSIYADGKRMYRIMENLFQNICKYAMEGTRVYMDLQVEESKEGTQKAVLILRNISAYSLNINESELMERFVRGDKSRSTEGSGLGLSITRDLAQLQGGTFDIIIDGDLFKVVMEFSIVS